MGMKNQDSARTGYHLPTRGKGHARQVGRPMSSHTRANRGRVKSDSRWATVKTKCLHFIQYIWCFGIRIWIRIASRICICFQAVPSEFHEFKRYNYSRRKHDMVIRGANVISPKNELSTAKVCGLQHRHLHGHSCTECPERNWPQKSWIKR